MKLVTFTTPGIGPELYLCETHAAEYQATGPTRYTPDGRPLCNVRRGLSFLGFTYSCKVCREEDELEAATIAIQAGLDSATGEV